MSFELFSIFRCRFIKSNYWSILLFCIFTTLLFAPEILLDWAPTKRGYIITYVHNFLLCATISSWIILFGQCLKSLCKVCCFIWYIFLLLTICIYSIGEFLLVLDLGFQWNVTVFQVIQETTFSEATGFFINTVHLLPFLLFFFLILAIIRVAYYSSFIEKLITWQRINKYVIICFAIVLLLFSSVFRSFSFDYGNNYNTSNKFLKRSTLWNTYQSFLLYLPTRYDYEICAESQKLASIDSVSYTSSNIVVIIGESFNRHHSSLYGYKNNTNPNLSSKPNCYIFEDVIAPINITEVCFKYFLSMARVGGQNDWQETPLVLTFFKKAGYNVVFYSNQYVAEASSEYHDVSAGFINHPKVSPFLFSNRNHKKYNFDEDLIEDYLQHRSDLEKDSLNLIIFHLIGQHQPASWRYPKAFAQFGESDYAYRQELSQSMKEEVAQYDNAVLYNDHVVSKIVESFMDNDAIILYFADHGDEANDFRPKMGRARDFEAAGAQCIKNQLDVPFVIFTTDEYKEKHQLIINQIENSLDRPFMTDDLPYFLLYLGGINTKWYDSTKNLIDPDFDTSRRRIIYGSSIDYDKAVTNN